MNAQLEVYKYPGGFTTEFEGTREVQKDIVPRPKPLTRRQVTRPIWNRSNGFQTAGRSLKKRGRLVYLVGRLSRTEVGYGIA